jgi:hypothetical protein
MLMRSHLCCEKKVHLVKAHKHNNNNLPLPPPPIGTLLGQGNLSWQSPLARRGSASILVMTRKGNKLYSPPQQLLGPVSSQCLSPLNLNVCRQFCKISTVPQVQLHSIMTPDIDENDRHQVISKRRKAKRKAIGT